MKKSIWLTFFLLMIGSMLYAQTADEIQTLLTTSAVSYAQAARFVLEAADVSGSYDKTSGQDASHSASQNAAQNALRFAVENKWLTNKADGDGAISLEQLSLLIMKAFDLKGGPMYSLFNSAHYSYRELVYMDIIQGRSDPQMKVTGERFLAIISRLLYLDEEGRLVKRQEAAQGGEQ